LSDERGSISLVIVAALGFCVILASLVADVARASAAKARAQAAADAAALAAAQEQILSSGRRPADVAAEYAASNGARLVSCRCPERGAETRVIVEVEVSLPGLRVARTVRATARAVVDASVAERVIPAPVVPPAWSTFGQHPVSEAVAEREMRPGRDTD
jgi:secretion/DNA translocation related TadE-like protein